MTIIHQSKDNNLNNVLNVFNSIRNILLINNNINNNEY